uniref:Uncharacterized protein n=1 Tax=Arundo donax TaxID=35708 RepID=A0A0A8Z277_ARUDO
MTFIFFISSNCSSK